MLFFGDGGAVASARCWWMVAELTSLLVDLGGLQQPVRHPGLTEEAARALEESDREAWALWEDRARRLISEVGRALGFKVTIVKEDC